jgi:hypothetical protein
MNGWEIDFNAWISSSNNQAVFGPAPDFTPGPIYYGLIFADIIKDGGPEIIQPTMESFISSQIKVFGYTTGDIFKVLLINKDTNTSLNGTVQIKSDLTMALKCIYMQAPSLTSKTGITIAGYNFVGGNSTVNGTYE